jgi:NhaA family Na+:H+ antiporter
MFLGQDMAFTRIRHYLKLESTSGIFLLIATLVALIMDNSPLSVFYQTFITAPIHMQWSMFQVNKPLLFWINEGLMTLFFLSVGLELKRELLEGQFKMLLPGIGALGGMIIPALIFMAMNYSSETAKGWATPVATDIAFALGALSLFGKKIPLELKLFLMALAMFDDMGAIIIIAFFYTHSFSYVALGVALLLMLILKVLNYVGVRFLTPYLLIGVILWVCVLQSGIHATIAGVLLAFFIPLENSLLRKLENAIHPWVAFLIMPLFAFANAGVSMKGINLEFLKSNLVMGIILGLVIGKQLGVFSFVWGAVRLGLVQLPNNLIWKDIYGVALLCGIGFTMSLFLGTLAFGPDNSQYLIQVRVGVLLGSLISGIMGALFLYKIKKS